MTLIWNLLQKVTRSKSKYKSPGVRKGKRLLWPQGIIKSNWQVRETGWLGLSNLVIKIRYLDLILPSAGWGSIAGCLAWQYCMIIPRQTLLNTESHLGPGSHDPEITTWAKTKSPRLNRLGHPGTPDFMLAFHSIWNYFVLPSVMWAPKEQEPYLFSTESQELRRAQAQGIAGE